jgi:hypothetical protein
LIDIRETAPQRGRDSRRIGCLLRARECGKASGVLFAAPGHEGFRPTSRYLALKPAKTHVAGLLECRWSGAGNQLLRSTGESLFDSGGISGPTANGLACHSLTAASGERPDDVLDTTTGRTSAGNTNVDDR